MKSKVIKLSLFLMIFNIGSSDIFATKQSKKIIYHLVPATDNTINTIIFDLGDVLFTTSRSAKLKSTLPVIFKNPSLMYSLCKMDVKQELFTMLDKIPAKTSPHSDAMYNDGKKIPQIMVDWMTCSSNQDIYDTTINYIKTTNYPHARKQLFIAIAQFMFNSKTLANSQITIKPMVKLALLLKEYGYKLYVLSNWSKEASQLLRQKHKKLFDLFDGVMISGEEGLGKPHPNFYQRLLTKYNLEASECSFIDDEPNNIDAAQRLGIQSVLHDSMPSVYEQLQAIGILKV